MKSNGWSTKNSYARTLTKDSSICNKNTLMMGQKATLNINPKDPHACSNPEAPLKGKWSNFQELKN